jgi:hypothetical protein
VQLLEIEPPIWRSFLLKKEATFQNLHAAIQDACGWQDYHIYAFREDRGGPAIAGIPDDEYDSPDPDAEKVKVSSYFSEPGQSCLYLYDFGDDWWHEVKLIDVVSLKDKFVRMLTGGERAFPPEDCGGIWGYEVCVAIQKGEKVELVAKELRQRKKWIGDWQPERFDLKAVAKEFDG